jgi:hypothetical protein
MTRSTLFVVALVLGTGFVPWTMERLTLCSSSFAAEADEPDATPTVSPDEGGAVPPDDYAGDQQEEVQQDEEDQADGE